MVFALVMEGIPIAHKQPHEMERHITERVKMSEIPKNSHTQDLGSTQKENRRKGKVISLLVIRIQKGRQGHRAPQWTGLGLVQEAWEGDVHLIKDQPTVPYLFSTVCVVSLPF